MLPSCARSYSAVALPPAQAACLVRLPDLTGAHVEGRQPAAGKATRIDAFQVADIQNVSAKLRSVAHNGDLSRAMRWWDHGGDVCPEQDLIGLVIQFPISDVVGVHEQMRVGFEVSPTLMQELPV